MKRRLDSAAARVFAAALCYMGLVAGCSDFGDPVSVPQPVGPTPLGATLDELIPARTVPGDSVRVRGSGFGATPDGATFRFWDGGLRDGAEAEVLSWSDDQLIVLVPVGAVDGPTHLERDGATVSGPSFAVAPRSVSYFADIVPILDRFGCTSCHGGSGGLNVRPWTSLVAGNSDSGPVVVPRHSAESLMVVRLLPETPATLRMPQGGPYLDTDQILLMADWVDQGALDN